MPGHTVNRERLSEAVRLAERVGYAFVTTSDDKGWPHLAMAGRMTITPEGHIAVAEWFCPGTVKNLQLNPKLGIVVWDSASDTGYQLVGELEELKDISMLDGFTPGEPLTVPQVERQLIVHIDRMMEFKHAPHTDLSE